MFKRSNLLTSLLMLVLLSIGFYACDQSELVTPENPVSKQSLFKTHLADNTQTISASDQGNGTYNVTGAQGTRVEINNALVDAAGNRVRGTIDIVLIEIYSVSDMILNRKQTLADYDGQLKGLESGGEIFVKAYQNGEELFADGNGVMNLFLPTENTGGARTDMELFYGEETGDQIIWKPTGESIRVVNNSDREEGSEYLVMIQNILGWVNVDVVYSLPGEPVECLEVVIECEETCRPIDASSTVVALYINGLNSAFEMTYAGGNTFRLCGIEGEGDFPLGGITATFVVVIDCGNGTVQTAIVTTVITPGNHVQVVGCDELQFMEAGQLEEALHNLL